MFDIPSAADQIAHNLRVIMAALKTAGIEAATLSYSGRDDDGQVNELAITPDNESALLTPVVVMERNTHYSVSEDKWECSDELKEMRLEDALHDLACCILEERRPGWDIKEGSEGKLTINVAEGGYELDHTSYFAEHETETLCG